MKKAGGPGAGKKRERQGSVVARYAQKKAAEAVEQEKREMAKRMKALGIAIDENDGPPEIAPARPKPSEDVIIALAQEVGGPAASPTFAEFTEPGSLGLRMESREGGGAVVLAIIPGQQAENHSAVRAGMALLSVTDQHGSTIKLAKMPYDKLLAKLKGSGRPITLAFVMPLSSEATAREADLQAKQDPNAAAIVRGHCSGSVEVQYKGKGKFEQVWLALAPGNPSLLFREGRRDGKVVRSGDADGCTVGLPKQQRKGHPIAFRLDLKDKDSNGCAKYIIAVDTQEELDHWIDSLKSYSTEGQPASLDEDGKFRESVAPSPTTPARDEEETVGSSLIAHTFTDQGPLGLSWGMARSDDETIETAVLKGTKAGSPAGKIAGSLGLVPGVTLVAVNDSRCAGLSYTEQIQLIRDAHRPLIMVFGPKGKSAARAEIEEVYGRHAPEKLAEVDTLVQKYGERKLLTMVWKKYLKGAKAETGEVQPSSALENAQIIEEGEEEEEEEEEAEDEQQEQQEEQREDSAPAPPEDIRARMMSPAEEMAAAAALVAESEDEQLKPEPEPELRKQSQTVPESVPEPEPKPERELGLEPEPEPEAEPQPEQRVLHRPRPMTPAEEMAAAAALFKEEREDDDEDDEEEQDEQEDDEEEEQQQRRQRQQEQLPPSSPPSDLKQVADSGASEEEDIADATKYLGGLKFVDAQCDAMIAYLQSTHGWPKWKAELTKMPAKEVLWLGQAFSREKTLKVTFEQLGPVGITWTNAKDASDADTAVLKAKRPGGPADDVDDLVPGLRLHSVDGQQCAGLSYLEQIDLIRTAERPLTMAFTYPMSAQRLQVEELYRKFNPAKLDDVDKLIIKYGEDELARMVKKKYTEAEAEPKKAPKPVKKIGRQTVASPKPKGLRRLSVALGVTSSKEANSSEDDTASDRGSSDNVASKELVQASANAKARAAVQARRQAAEVVPPGVEPLVSVMFKDEGPTGVQFKWNEKARSVEIFRIQSGSQANRMPLVPGMVVYSIGGVKMKGVELQDVNRDLERSSRPLRMRFYPPNSPDASPAKVDGLDDMPTSELRSLAKYSDSDDSEGAREPERSAVALEPDGRVSVVVEGEEGEEEDSPVSAGAASIVTAVFKDSGPVGITWFESQVPGVAVMKDTKPGSPASRVPSLVPGLVLHSVNGQLCAGKLYADQIGFIRASGRPLTIDFRAPLPNEKYFLPKLASERPPGKTAGETNKVQRPTPQKVLASEDRSPASPASPAPLSLMPSSSKSSTSDSPSLFKQPRPSGRKPEEGVPPPRRQATTPSVQAATGLATSALPMPITLSPSSPLAPSNPAQTHTSRGGTTPQARFNMAEIRARELVPYSQDHYYRCTQRCVLRKGFSLDSPKVGLLEVGDVCVVLEARLNEARTTRVKLAEPGSKLAAHAASTLGGGSMYFAPGERWASATMTDGTQSIQPLIEMRCTKRTQLRSGFGMDSEKVGVLEAGQTVGLALKRQNEAGMTRCKLVLPSNGAVCWASETSSKGEVVLVQPDDLM